MKRNKNKIEWLAGEESVAAQGGGGGGVTKDPLVLEITRLAC